MLSVLRSHRRRHWGARLSRSKIVSALRRSGRSRNIEKRAEEIQAALRADYLRHPGHSRGPW